MKDRKSLNETDYLIYFPLGFIHNTVCTIFITIACPRQADQHEKDNICKVLT